MPRIASPRRRALAGSAPVLMLLAVAFLGCTPVLASGDGPASEEIPVPDETPVPAESHRLSIGESAVIGSWTLRFLAVSSDNRCPVDANCIVGGEAVVLYQLTAAHDPDAGPERRLDVPPGGTELAVDGDLRLRVDVEPQTHLDRPIEASEYRLVVEVAPEI